MGAKITICHWNEGGSWDSLELPAQAIEAQGHPNHDLDIWPPSAETPGHNWPQGEAIFLNGCAMVIHPEPTATPSPSPSLPESGGWGVALLVVGSMTVIVLGLLLVAWSDKAHRRTLNDSKDFRDSRPEDPDG